MRIGLKGLLLALAIAATPAIASAQSALPDADPAIWVVKDSDTTIYLFGTFHLLDGKSEWFNDEVRTAFDASQEVVLEAIPSENPMELQSLVLKLAVDPNGRTLSSKLTPELLRKLNDQLSPIGMSAAALDAMEPWFVTTLLAVRSLQKVGLTGDVGAEAVISKAAKEAGKPLGALESVEFQLQLFDQIPEDLQVKMLQVSLEEIDEIDDVLTPMLAAWSSGDVEGFARIFHEDMLKYPELYDLLLADRNKSWADWIQQRLDKPGTVFIAVGAGHLAGKDNVQEQLKARGIASARVRP